MVEYKLDSLIVLLLQYEVWHFNVELNRILLQLLNGCSDIRRKLMPTALTDGRDD